MSDNPKPCLDVEIVKPLPDHHREMVRRHMMGELQHTDPASEIHIYDREHGCQNGPYESQDEAQDVANRLRQEGALSSNASIVMTFL